MNLKAHYMDRLTAQLNGWNAEIQRMEATMRRVPPHLRVLLEEQIVPLREKRNHAWQKLEEIQASPDGLTEELKQSVEIVWDRLRESIEHTRSHFKLTHPMRARIVGEPHPHVYATHAVQPDDGGHEPWHSKSAA